MENSRARNVFDMCLGIFIYMFFKVFAWECGSFGCWVMVCMRVDGRTDSRR